MELLKIISPFLTFLHHLYHNSRTKWGQSFPGRPSVRPLPSYLPALLRTTLTEPECRHLTPRAHWHHLKPRMGSVCAAEPRIIAQSGANGPVQTVWAAAVPPCVEAHRESSRRPPGILAVPSASASGPAPFHQHIFQQFSKENGTNKQTNIIGKRQEPPDRLEVVLLAFIVLELAGGTNSPANSARKCTHNTYTHTQRDFVLFIVYYLFYYLLLVCTFHVNASIRIVCVCKYIYKHVAGMAKSPFAHITWPSISSHSAGTTCY